MITRDRPILKEHVITRIPVITRIKQPEPPKVSYQWLQKFIRLNQILSLSEENKIIAQGLYNELNESSGYKITKQIEDRMPINIETKSWEINLFAHLISYTHQHS